MSLKRVRFSPPRAPLYGGVHPRMSKKERRRVPRVSVPPAEGGESYPVPITSPTIYPHLSQSISPQLQAQSESQEPHIPPAFTAPLSPLGEALAAPPAAHAVPDEYSERNLAKRPRDWRADYDPRGGLVPRVVSLFPRLRKRGSGIHEYVDPLKRTIHPLLLYSQSHPPIYHDLRFAPFPATPLPLSLPSTHLPNDFPNLEFLNIALDLMQLSSVPSASMLRLYHAKLPWYIDITASHPNGVTVFDILIQLFQQLNTKIDARHYYNDVLGPREREEVSRAFGVRCAGREDMIREGLRYVDFLGECVILRGFVRGKRGMWELQTSEIQ